jgi:hypothetical protein
MKTSRYSVWYDNEEQWDQDAIDPPALQCQTRSALEAAERLADSSDSSYGTFIVRDEETGVYRHIKLVRGWTVKSDQLTTLAWLCEP